METTKWNYTLIPLELCADTAMYYTTPTPLRGRNTTGRCIPYNCIIFIQNVSDFAYVNAYGYALMKLIYISLSACNRIISDNGPAWEVVIHPDTQTNMVCLSYQIRLSSQIRHFSMSAFIKHGIQTQHRYVLLAAFPPTRGVSSHARHRSHSLFKKFGFVCKSNLCILFHPRPTLLWLRSMYLMTTIWIVNSQSLHIVSDNINLLLLIISSTLR